MRNQRRYPTAVKPERVGRYPALAKAGGGYVWDEVLEYRVWCHPELGADDVADGSDYFVAFATYPSALAYSKRTRGAEEPIALVRQRQWIDEPRPGRPRQEDPDHGVAGRIPNAPEEDEQDHS